MTGIGNLDCHYLSGFEHLAGDLLTLSVVGMDIKVTNFCRYSIEIRADCEHSGNSVHQSRKSSQSGTAAYVLRERSFKINHGQHQDENKLHLQGRNLLPLPPSTAWRSRRARRQLGWS